MHNSDILTLVLLVTQSLIHMITSSRDYRKETIPTAITVNVPKWSLGGVRPDPAPPT